MADQIFTQQTELLATSKADISSIIQSYLVEKAVLLPTVMDVSRFAVKGNKSIDFPRASGFTVKDKAQATKTDTQVITYTTDTLALDKHKYIQWEVEKIAEMQTVIAVLEDTLMRAGSDIAYQTDVDIAAQLALASAAAPDHQIALSANIENDILDARELLALQKVDVKQLYLGVGPALEKAMLKVSNFIDASKYGSNRPVMNGEIGMVFGIPVIVSTVFGSAMYVWNKEAVAFGFQQGPEFDSEKNLRGLSTLYSIDQLYGTKVLDSGKRCVLVS